MEDSLRAAYEPRRRRGGRHRATLRAMAGSRSTTQAAMTAALSGALAAVPEATAMLIYTPDMSLRGVVRAEGRRGAGDDDRCRCRRPRKSPQVLRRPGGAPEGRRPPMGRVRGQRVRPVRLCLRAACRATARRKAGWSRRSNCRRFRGSRSDLSARFGTHAFILDGDDRVLADERLADPARRAGIAPLMPLSKFGDPVLAPTPRKIAVRVRFAQNARRRSGGDRARARARIPPNSGATTGPISSSAAR